MRYKAQVLTAIAAAIVLLVITPVWAFPDKPVEVIVPFAAGGGTDITTRAMQEPLSKALGENVVVKNNAGAGGTIGVAAVARAKSDGYILGMAPVGPLTTQPHLHKLPYDVDSFEYVCLAYSAPSAFAVRKDSKFNNLQELVEYGKKHPGKLMFAIDAVGSIPHLASLAFSEEAGIDINYLPVNGNGPALKALLDGSADVFIAHVSFLSQNKGQIKSLALLQTERLPNLPDLMTATEQGYDLNFPIWGGLVAPKGTPKDVVNVLDSACKSAVASDSFQELMERLGQPPKYMGSEHFEAFVREQYERNKKLLMNAGFDTE